MVEFLAGALLTVLFIAWPGAASDRFGPRARRTLEVVLLAAAGVALAELTNGEWGPGLRVLAGILFTTAVLALVRYARRGASDRRGV